MPRTLSRPPGDRMGVSGQGWNCHRQRLGDDGSKLAPQPGRSRQSPGSWWPGGVRPPLHPELRYRHQGPGHFRPSSWRARVRAKWFAVLVRPEHVRLIPRMRRWWHAAAALPRRASAVAGPWRSSLPDARLPAAWRRSAPLCRRWPVLSGWDHMARDEGRWCCPVELVPPVTAWSCAGGPGER